MRFVVLLISLLGVASCNRHAPFVAEEVYRDARASFERGELIEALGAAERGLRGSEPGNPDWAFRFRVLKAEVLAWQGKPQDSLALLEPAPPASLANSETAVRRLVVRGTASYLLQRFDDAAKSLAQAEQLAAQHPVLLGDVAMAQATLAIYKRDYGAAERLDLRVLDIARRDKRPYLEANALGTLGFMALRQQRYGAAVDWFTPSLKASQDLGNRALSAKNLGNLGWCYFKLGDYERAVEMFQQAEQLSSQLGLAKDQFLWLTNIGSVHYEQRNYSAAADYYQRALKIARGLDNKAGAAVCLNNLASTALETRQYDAAEAYNREALALKRALQDASSELYSVQNEARIAVGRKQFAEAAGLLQQVVAKSGDDASLRWEAESELANLYALQGNHASAEAQFRKALATIDQARSALSREEYRLSFLASAERFYEEYIDYLIARGRAREALLVAEHSRARTLAEGLKVPVAGVMGAGLNPEQTAGKLNAVILSYWLAPAHSYVWAVTASRVTVFTLPADAQIEADVQSYRKALLGPRDVKDTANASGTALYRVLVEPVQKLIAPGARVIVIGDSALNTLNFETLLAPQPQLHYWIEDAIISNASSIALLAGAARKPGAVKKLLLIGDPIYAGTEYPELKEAKLEMEDVEQHFAADRRTVLERTSATPAAYSASNAGAFAYIHFVAHGTASQVSPLDSSIILSRQSDEFKLYARDIMKQPLRAELVTISACYGAGTRSYSGEGLVGLSWAFLRAGAHSVIAALWDVSDVSTPQLMDAMYARLQEGADPAAALRDAKLKMLRSGTVYRRPFYWGAFQVYTGP